ncbi:MAG: sulfotransferase [Halioglobus sp.]
MKKTPRVPNLICIGVEKSGTTFLNAVFENSASILTPNKKELFYYNLNYERGLSWYQSWYDFSQKVDAPYVCDVTPSYFRNKKVIGRIKETAPDAKLLILVRHPVYRSFSHYVHRLRHVALKLESYDCSFEQVLAGAGGHGDIFPKYYEHFARWLEVFQQQNILVLSYEQDLFHPPRVEKKLRDFLAVDDLDFDQFRGNRINDGLMPKFYYGENKGVEVTIGESEYFIPKRTLVLAHAKGSKVWSKVDPELARANVEASDRWTNGLNRDDIHRIYENYYAEDVEKFSAAFSFDVQAWQQDDPVSYNCALPSDEFLR